MAWPSGSAARSAAARTASDSGRPAASRNCSRTMSSPVTSSVTPCSTWSRVLTSRNQVAPSGARRNSAVAAFRSPAAVATRTARSCRSRRSSVVRPGAGASSTSFWWRRWSEQSRSPMATTRPDRVAQQLDLDVARRPDDALQVDRAVAERGERLGRSGGQRGRQVGRRRDQAHAPSATAGRRLDHDREADPLGLGDDPVDGVRPVDRRRLQRSRDRVDPDRPGDATGMELVAERVDGGRRRPDEDEPGVLDGPREGRPLGQEAVARMDRLGAGRERRLDDRIDPEVALGGRGGPEPDRGVGQPDVPRVGVGIAVDGDRGHPRFVAGPDDPDRDLTAVGDQDPLERRRLAGSPGGRVFAQRRPAPGRLRGGCCHASFAGSCPACRPASSARVMSRGRVSDGRMTSST